jgi:hypothetical protein
LLFDVLAIAIPIEQRPDGEAMPVIPLTELTA